MNRFRKIYRDQTDAEQPQKERPKPQRHFEHGPPQSMPSPLWRKLQLISFWLIPLLVLLAIIGGGIAVTIKLQISRKEASISQSSTSTSSHTAHQNSYENFLAAYLETRGGRESLRSIDSAQTSGRFDDGERIWTIQITKTPPDTATILLELENTPSQRYEIEGHTIKRLSAQADEGERSNVLLFQKSEDSMLVYSRILDPLCMAALGGDATILSRSELSGSAREMLLLELQRPDGELVYCKVDRETNYLQSIEESIVKGGERFIRRVEYDDYRMVSGVVLPFRLKVFHDDLLQTELLVDSIRINQ